MRTFNNIKLILIFLVIFQANSAELSANDKTNLEFHQLNYLNRRKKAKVPSIFTFLKSAKYAKTFGVIEVPAIGAEKDRNGKKIKHNAASHGYRHGKKGTELAFQLLILSNEEKPRQGSCVWIPVDKRTVFWEEGFYLVPLFVQEEKVSKGNISFKNYKYDLLPSNITEFPRLTKKTFRKFVSTIKQWQELLNDNAGADKRCVFLKILLYDADFDGLHSDAISELSKLEYFDKEFKNTAELESWCNLMNNPAVNKYARIDIQNRLSIKLQDYAVKEALNIIKNWDNANNSITSCKKTDTSANKLTILKESFFKALETRELAYGSVKILSKVYRDEIKKTMLNWLKDPMNRVNAIKSGIFLADDVDFADKVIYWYKDSYSAIENNNALRIKRMANENRWIGFSECMPYFFNKESYFGKEIINDSFFDSNISFTDKNLLIDKMIKLNDRRFTETIYKYAENLSLSGEENLYDKLAPALAYLCCIKHKEGIKLSIDFMQKPDIEESQQQILLSSFNNYKSSLSITERITDMTFCVEWLKGLEN